MRATHKLRVLKRLYSTDERLTGTDFTHISNVNQYFVELEHQGLIVSEWGYKGNAKVKFRIVTDEIKDKVRKYLLNHNSLDETNRGA